MRIVAVHRSICFAALVGVSGCGESDPSAATSGPVTDSAGINIVTSPPGDVVYARVADEAVLSVGEQDGPEEYLFGRVASVARDGEGNLVVADSRAGEIRLFDARAGHLRTIGGKGEGPGEFGSLSGAWPGPAGGIVALDRGQQRITRFSADGSLIGTAGLAGIGEMGMFSTRGMAGAEMVLSQVTDMGLPSDEEAAQDLEEALEDDGAMVQFLRHRLDGTLVDTLARRRGERTSTSTSESGGMMLLQLLVVPFSPRPVAAGSPHGVAVSGGGRYEVGLFDVAGVLHRIVRLDEDPALRTDEHLEAHVRGSGRRLRDEASIQKTIDMYRDLPMPDRLPGYVDLLFADTGELWARRYGVPGGETAHFHWDVFGTDGHHLGRVEVSTSLRIREVSRNQVVGISRDELGVERVEVRDLTLSGG